MDFGIGTYAVSFAAGLVSLLSPCVLPILPILIASALSRHRLGPLALAMGLALSFAVVGTFIATVGASIGLGAQTLRRAAAVLMVVFGAIMLSSRLQVLFGKVSARVGSTGQQALGAVKGEGPASQFLMGLLLGLVWSPCVGPTLGAATTLAAQGHNLGQIALLMAIFGLGAGLPLLLLGGVSHASMMRMRGSLASFGHTAKWLMGGLFVLFGLLILSGLDHRLEAMLLSISPDWLTQLTTSL
jgi:cytochrome c-type biogenesis protein